MVSDVARRSVVCRMDGWELRGGIGTRSRHRRHGNGCAAAGHSTGLRNEAQYARRRAEVIAKCARSRGSRSRRSRFERSAADRGVDQALAKEDARSFDQAIGEIAARAQHENDDGQLDDARLVPGRR